MAAFLYRLGAFSARRRGTVIVGWLALLGAIFGLALMFAGSFTSSGSIADSPAQTALTKMDQHFPEPDQKSGEVIFQAAAGHTLTEPALSAAWKASLAASGTTAGVSSVSDPSDAGVSADGRTVIAAIYFDTISADDVPDAVVSAVRTTGVTAQQAGLTVVYSGDAFRSFTSAIGSTELIGVLVALAILIITFGSMTAAGLPMLTAILGVVGSLTAIIGLTSIFGISATALTLAAMLGLAVGIDYALFIVSRHRSQLSSGVPVTESIALATATAGSAVVFAGATVVIALAGLTVAGVPVLTSMGLATAGAVAMAVVMALTLLPALMAVAGVRLIPKPNSRTVKRTIGTGTPSMGVRWISAITRHPVMSLASVTVGLLVLAAPVLQLKLALTDDGSEPDTSSSRQAYDIVTDAFGPGANGPLIVLIENDTPGTVATTAETVLRQLHDVGGIAGVSDINVAEDGTAARIQVTPTTGPRTQETSDLVTRLRSMSAAVSVSSDSYVAVTGLTAVSIDISAKLAGALVPFALVVVGLSLLLLLIAFRSIAIPIKAAIGFLLSVGAALGATVAVFQWGWLADALGVPSQGPVASLMPIIVMAVLFGLAMDYEVFLVSGMREDYSRRRDARGAVIAGARSASRVVTAAALIMIAVFISFLFSKNADIMPIAFALSFGVLVDAFAVRMTLVPAVMTLLGDRAWSLPRWLERFVPNIDVEGHNLRPVAQPNDESLVLV